MQTLRPVELDGIHQLPDVLAGVVERFRRDSGISARFVSNVESIHLPSAASIEVVRIVQEALANVRKHSRARNVLVRLTGKDETYTLTVEDDGRGFDIESAKKESLGLRNMEHRTQLLGGTIEWKPGAERGTVIVIRIPMGN